MISLVPLEGIPEVRPGDDLAEMIAAALAAAGIGLTDDDVLVVTQKVVSKAEGRVVDLSTVEPGPEARGVGRALGQGPAAGGAGPARERGGGAQWPMAG